MNQNIVTTATFKADTSQLQSGLLAANAALGRTAKATENLAAQAAKADVQMKSIGKSTSITAGLNVVTTMASAAGKAYSFLSNSVEKSMESYSKMKRVMSVSGADQGDIAGLRMMARDVGENAGIADKAFEKLATTIGQAGQGNQEAIQKMQMLGYSLEDIQSGSITAGDAMRVAMDRFASIEDASEAAAIATKLFEEEGRGLIPVLSQGSAALNEMAANAYKVGTALDDVASERMERLISSISKLTTAWDGLMNKIATSDAVVNALGGAADSAEYIAKDMTYDDYAEGFNYLMTGRDFRGRSRDIEMFGTRPQDLPTTTTRPAWWGTPERGGDSQTIEDVLRDIRDNTNPTNKGNKARYSK